MFMGETCRAPAPTPGCLLNVHGLVKRYGTHQALNGLSLSVSRREIVGLVGSNGSGKTTSLRILAGLLRPDAGHGSVLGLDLIRDANQIRRRVGYLSQRYSLYPNLSVKDNLHFRAEVFGLQNPTQAIAAVLDRLGLRPFADLPAAQLSGGWGRLLQLAAALVHDPQIVLLDEPTAGLDAVARQAVWRQITRLANEETALVLSTHDLLDAGRCSRIVFLSQGTERASGRPTDLVCATNGTVLAVLGPRVLGLVELLQAIPGVITTYLSGECLRVVVARGSESRVMSTPELRDFAIEPVPPTLEDAVLALSETEPRGSG